MISEIFLPMFYMMLLTLIVFSLSLSLRLKEIYLDKKVSGEEHRHPPFDQGSNLLKNAQRNLSNLFEFPIFFYAICICIYITDSTDELFLTFIRYEGNFGAVTGGDSTGGNSLITISNDFISGLFLRKFRASNM